MLPMATVGTLWSSVGWAQRPEHTLSALPEPHCCATRPQTRQQSIVGGKFSLLTLSQQKPQDSNSYFNPACNDALVFVAFYLNLAQGTGGAELNQEMLDTGVLQPCGGLCLPESPICKQLRPENKSAPHPDFSEGGFMASTFCLSRPDPFGNRQSVPCPSYDNVRRPLLITRPLAYDVAPEPRTRRASYYHYPTTMNQSSPD